MKRNSNVIVMIGTGSIGQAIVRRVHRCLLVRRPRTEMMVTYLESYEMDHP